VKRAPRFTLALVERTIQFLHENWLLLLFVVAIAAAFILLRSSPTALADEAAFDAAIANGQPTIVEFYSNY